MPAKSMEEIAVYLKNLRFRKKIVRGADESDVWKQLERLHGEYQAAFDAQQERSGALLAERDAEIRRLREQLGEAAQLDHGCRDETETKEERPR